MFIVFHNGGSQKVIATTPEEALSLFTKNYGLTPIGWVKP